MQGNSNDNTQVLHATAIPASVEAQPTAVAVTSVKLAPAVLASATGAILPPEPKGTWRDGLCDCCNDIQSCACIWCCGQWGTAILVGQLGERVWHRKAYTVVLIGAITIYLIFVITISVGASNYEKGGCQTSTDTEVSNGHTSTTSTTRCTDGNENPPGYDAAKFFMSLYAFAIFILTCQIRQLTRRLYDIKPQCCGECEDCCCSYWCMLCECS